MRLTVTILIACCAATWTVAQQPEEKGSAVKGQTDPRGAEVSHEGSVWMKKKLDYSQAILSGLARGDFESIKTNGIQMRLLNRVESFVRRRDSRYRLHLRVFENACDEIVDQANKENLAGATLAFNQLTVNCVNCHRVIRNGPAPEQNVAPKPEGPRTP